MKENPITQTEIFNSEVRALTIKEPFASAMLHGKQETRNRPTNVRGLVLICAGLKNHSFETELEICGSEQLRRLYGTVPLESERPGYAVGIGRLVSSIPMAKYESSEVVKITMEAECFVKYNRNLHIWQFADVRAIEPVKFKGSQGWKFLSAEQKAQIKLI